MANTNFDFLNDLGIAKSSNAKFNFDNVDDVINYAALQFIKNAKSRIKSKNRINKGYLSDIQVLNYGVTGNKANLFIGYESSNPAINYEEYNDLGVNGTKRNVNPNSPFKFRNPNVSSSFVKSIMQWYLSHKNYIKQETQIHNLTKLQRKRKTIGQIAESTKIKSIAYATAKSIKKKGIKPIGFTEYAIDKSFNDDFVKKLASALGKDVAISIRKNTKQNGNNN